MPAKKLLVWRKNPSPFLHSAIFQTSPRPVSDLRNKFTEIENAVQGENPVYLTKNGYGTMVVLSLEKYSELTDNTDYIEAKLDEADQYTKTTYKRLTHEEVFDSLRRSLDAD